MKRHAETIKGIGKAYPEALEGMKQFAAESGQMLETRLRGDLMRTQEQIKKMSEEFINAVANPAARSGIELLIQKIGGLKEGVMIVKNEFEMFRTPILEFNKSIRDGKPDVDALKRSLDEIPNTTPEVIKLKNEIIDLLDKGLNRASGEAKIIQEALSRLGAEMNGTAAATRAFNDAMKTLQGIEPKQIDNMTRANNALSEAMKNQNLTEQQRIALQNEHAAAAGRVNEAAAAVAAEEAKRLAEAAAREAEYFKQREENEKLFLQNGLNNLTLSWGTREEQLAAHLTREQELIQQARDKEVIDDQTHKALMERSEQEYQSRIAQLRAMNNITALKDLGTFFKGAEALAKSNGDKSFKTAKAFAIASGVLSTVSAAIQAMNDPTAITPFQKFANYAAVLGKGLSAVASIRGMSPSSGGGGGGSSGASGSSGGTPEGASSPSSRMGQSVFINLQGQSFGRDQVRSLVEQIASYQKDGGQVVFA